MTVGLTLLVAAAAFAFWLSRRIPAVCGPHCRSTSWAIVGADNLKQCHSCGQLFYF